MRDVMVVIVTGAICEDVIQRAARSGEGSGARAARRRARVAMDVHKETRVEAVERF